jgi:hypothetical protein
MEINTSNTLSVKKGDTVRVRDGSIWIVNYGPDDQDYVILQEIGADGKPTDYFEEEALHEIMEVLN